MLLYTRPHRGGGTVKKKPLHTTPHAPTPHGRKENTMKKKMYIWELHGMTAEEWNASHPAAPARPANPFSTDGRQATRRTTRTTTTNAPATADPENAAPATAATDFAALLRKWERAYTPPSGNCPPLVRCPLLKNALTLSGKPPKSGRLSAITA